MKCGAGATKTCSSRPCYLAWSLALALAVSSCGTRSPESESDRAEVTQRVARLLTLYASNDQEGVLSMLDRSSFTLYGSDAAELVRTPAAVCELMTNDFVLWKTARFGEIQDLDLFLQGAVATAYFHAPFSVSDRRPILVRFSTTWRKVEGEWLLIQSANTVPTIGSSAAELAKRK
jgi:hypothetical protein